MFDADVSQISLNLLRVGERRDLAQDARADGAYGHVNLEGLRQHFRPSIVLELTLGWLRAV